MNKLSAFIYFTLSFLFYGLAVIINGSLLDIVSVLFFISVTSLAFIIHVSPFLRTERLFKRSLSFGSGVHFLFITTIILFVIMYTNDGIPYFSDDVNRDRVKIIEKYGIIYRIAVQLIFILVPSFIYLRSRSCVGKKATFFFISVLFILLISTGFRSRIIDFVFIVLISNFVLSMEAVDRLKKYLKPNIKKVVLLIVAFFIVLHLTKDRLAYDSYLLALKSISHRIFLLNYEVNFDRLYKYIEVEGYFFGKSFIRDILSIVFSEVDSTSQTVTKYFSGNSDDVFTMTPTFYGESLLNFGRFGAVFIFPLILLLRWIIENLFLIISNTQISKVVYFSLLINLIYYVPRTLVTVGLVGMIVSKILPLVIITVSWVLISRKLEKKYV